MFKKYLQTTVLTLGLISFCVPANASETKRLDDGFFFKPYVGLGYTRTQADFKTISGLNGSDFYAGGYNSANIFAGSRIHKHLGFELGYNHSGKESKDFSLLGTAGKTDTKLKSYSLDVLGYLPIPNHDSFELIGSIGVGKYKADTAYTLGVATAKEKISKTTLRLGLGGQYFVKENISVKAMFHYANIDKEVIDDVKEYSLGVSYHF